VPPAATSTFTNHTLAATCRSIRSRSIPPARPSRRQLGTHRRSSRSRTSCTRNFPSHSSHSNHTPGSRRSGRHRGPARRRRAPVPHRESDRSWENSIRIGTLNRSLHVTTRERGKPRSVADSIPPDAKQDPHRADRHGKRRREILPAHAERLWHFEVRDHRDGGMIGLVDRRRNTPGPRKRLILPGGELAATGLRVARTPSRRGGRLGTERAAAGGFRRGLAPNGGTIGRDRTAGEVAAAAERRRSDLRGHYRRRRQNPHESS